MALTSPNRVRHGKMFFDVILPYIMNEASIVNLDTGSKINKWGWGMTGKRLGSVRSADGVVLDLPDAPKSKTNGDSVVLKLVTSYDKYPEDEVKIARKAGNAGIGPHIYAAYKVKLSSKLRQDIEESIDDEGLGPLNLLKGASTQIAPYLYIIIMENLYKNPKRGVVSAKDLYEYTNKKPFLPELRRKIDRLHQLGIAHGDMHTRNIIVQTVKSPTGKTRHVVKIIDYGRSLTKSSPIRGSSSENRLIMAGGGKLSPYKRHFQRRSGVPRLFPKVAWKNIAASNSKIRPAQKSQSQSYMESREASSPSVPRGSGVRIAATPLPVPISSRKPSMNNVPLARRKYGFNIKGRAIMRGPKGGLYVMQGTRKIYKPVKSKGNSREILRGPKGGMYYLRSGRKVYV